MPEPKLSEETRSALHARARGRCECTRRTCKHPREEKIEQCTRTLGDNWEAHRISAGGEYVLSNLEALCVPCHVQTRTYGVG